MNHFHDEAFTLRTYPYGDAHKIAVFLTRSHGRLRGVAYGASRSKSRFGSSLEPLTRVRVSFNRKENQELAVIQHCEILQPLPAFQLNWEQNLHVSYFSELLFEFSREEQDSEKLFRLSRAVVDAATAVRIEVLARYFELWLLHLEGVLPPLHEKLPDSLAHKAGAMLKSHPSRLVEHHFSEEELKRLESTTSKLVEYHLEKQLRSWIMLKKLL